MAEEEAHVAFKTTSIIAQILSSHINNADNIKQFADKQISALQYAANRYTFKNDNVNQFGNGKGKNEHELKNHVLSDPITRKLIKRFKYMRDHGILEKLRKKLKK